MMFSRCLRLSFLPCRCAKCHILKGYGILALIAVSAVPIQFWHNWHKCTKAL
jgi:hypothetical protein